MPEPVNKLPPVIDGQKRRVAIDAMIDEMGAGGPKPRHPAASKPAVPERNSTYDEMEARIYGDKSAKTKR